MVRQLPRGWWILIIFLLLGPPLARAQVGPAEQAQFQRRLRAMGSGHRFWDVPADSLRRVLASQRVDSLRLQTLEHLFFLAETDQADEQELAQLASKLRYPERVPLRLLVVATTLRATKPINQRAVLDTLQAAQRYFNALGPTPVVRLIDMISRASFTLQPSAAWLANMRQQVAYYEQHGPLLNAAFYCHALARYYEKQGDYNRCINYSLRAMEFFRTSSSLWYYNDLTVVAADYVDWGNGARALPYLHQVLAWPKLPFGNWLFATYTLALSYQQQGRYHLALRYLECGLDPHRPRGKEAMTAYIKTFFLVLKSDALLGLGRAGQARPLLLQAQHLADSLHLPLSSGFGYCELNATWARYYAAVGDAGREEAAWLAAYRQASQAHVARQRLTYLRGLVTLYQQQGQLARAAPYALRALALADTVSQAQLPTHVAEYELVRADRVQQARLAGLRLAQVQETARARRQRLLLGATLLVLALVAGLGYVLWRASRRQQRANEALGQLNAAVTAQRDQTTRALTELRTTQAQLIQKEKMASLGELTAGIAHEIQNPLNFVNNFADVSQELVAELEEAQALGDRAEVAALAADVRDNLRKIAQHGQRASGIVRGMLEHSRQSTGERQLTNLNQLADEYLKLAYRGLRTKHASTNAELQIDLAPNLPLVEAVPGDVGRVLLNLFANALYAVQQRQRAGEAGYVPTVSLRTRQAGQQVEVQVSDNGTGMSAEVQAKVFQPFFTTKPSGEGTGLGLSLSYDIITQGHGGSLSVESQPGQGSIFTVSLPLGEAPPREAV